MAAPATKNIRSFEGKWQIYKPLSNDTDPVLSLQGIGWMTRKTIGLATITQHIKQTAEDGVPHITIDQTLTGGLKGTQESRILDWQYRPHGDWLFGDVNSRSRYTKLSTIKSEGATNSKKGEITDADIEEDLAFLTEGWLEESGGENGEVIETFAENEKSAWTAWQVWGFANVKVESGATERWFVRRIVTRKTKGKGVVRVQLCHKFEGEL